MTSTENKLQRNQPVYLLDKGYYQVLVYDPDQKEDILISFGDKFSPKVTEQILEGDSKTLDAREKYLSSIVQDDDSRNPAFWDQRYIYLSDAPYKFYISPQNEELLNPVFPAPSALDPVYAYPTVVDPYAYPQYYNPYYNPYYTPYYYGGLGLAGFATGALLGGALSGGYYGGYRGGGGGYRGGGGGHGRR